ncbi:regulatory protein RecX [Eubacterium oxidoreducens]|uniref:Regulatory protein RecX n=1 Tax=Eubacterium oxidoreducens TaxID=1732 RepID=A0A1G6CTU5_EUBOX|nr:regulatory protein RecX [Eubacterium oxidoreducens]SDB36347.1 regulatory protein [Eubacterium oxidoreducens]
MEIIHVKKEKKGKYLIGLENGITLPLYQKDCPHIKFEEGADMDESTYRHLILEVLRIRIQKRTLYLLEKMDRTQAQLQEKLRQNHYPEMLIEHAIQYAMSFHYIDDERYIQTYIRQHKEAKSKQRMRYDLLQKGCDRQLVDTVFEQIEDWEEEKQIFRLLKKRKYNPENSDEASKRKTYQYLLRRGYKNEDVLRVMKNMSDESD